MEKIAVFDFDKTCVRFDSEEEIFDFMLKQDSVSEDTKWLIKDRFVNYTISSVERCIRATKMFTWFSKQQIQTWAREMLSSHTLQICESTKSLYDRCKQEWYKIYIVTASVTDLVEIIAEHFGYEVESIIWSELEIHDGIYADNIIQLPCFENKVDAIKKHIWAVPDICVWDSPNDTAMLSYSKQWYVVPSDERMLPLVEQYGRHLLEEDLTLQNTK